MKNAPTIVTIIGARPQFIKAAPVSLALKKAGIKEILIHTGQHYDDNMSAIFFEQLDLQAPQYHLNIGSGSHAYQTGEGLIQIEKILTEAQPDVVLVYGDTNATLAGALAAAKLHIPIAHVEAGLRSFNRKMPEEVNRVMTDHISEWLFAPTDTAVLNLSKENIKKGVYRTGDVMMDSICLYHQAAMEKYPNLPAELGLREGAYYLLTMHRAETTSHQQEAIDILRTLDELESPVLFPVHPRIRPLVDKVEAAGKFQNIHRVEPFGYLQMLRLESTAKGILTDSGGVQKEAAFFEVPCITLRTETEWMETVESGWNQIVGLSVTNLLNALKNFQKPAQSIKAIYGDGQASKQIAHVLHKALIQHETSKDLLVSF